jgi:cysteine desulfuration protein SufE
MSKLLEIEKEILSDFELFDTWEEKYHYIIELGQKLGPLEDKYKIEEYKIKGCQSSVWLNGEERDGKLFFSADSDSTFVKGEIALLMMVLSGQTAEDVLEAKLEFIDALGLRQHIAVTRANGLASMIKQMKTYAFAMSSANK